MITGITLIRNGQKLGYPWELCIRSMLSCCEQVIINCDIADDDTFNQLCELEKDYPIHIYVSKWNMKNTGNGEELAIQANKLLPMVQSDWVLYLQADELIHEDDGKYLSDLTDNIPANYSQIEFWRTYFWESITRRNSKYELYLGRLFRTGTHVVGGDGMHLIRGHGDVWRTNKMIYHYSRMGDEQLINQRIKTLDGLFHEESIVKQMPVFSYNNVDPSDLMPYTGKHPEGIIERYGK